MNRGKALVVKRHPITSYASWVNCFLGSLTSSSNSYRVQLWCHRIRGGELRRFLACWPIYCIPQKGQIRDWIFQRMVTFLVFSGNRKLVQRPLRTNLTTFLWPAACMGEVDGLTKELSL